MLQDHTIHANRDGSWPHAATCTRGTVLAAAADKKLLRDLGISLPQIAAAWRRFDETDAEKLVKLTREQPALEATSRSREFGESSWS